MTPVFAVVGHPNKGKSSIVATLAQDDSVAISAQSGTTRVAETIQVEIGSSRFALVDTPGFQRPARVLQWLEQHADSAEQRQDAVRKFVEDPDCWKQFPDEVELLRPIVGGAAILYVVDGSRPYGSEYEAEMEILRWTGQASMALINPIANEQHIASWQQALSQYFKVVKVFNAVQADFEKQMSILEAFSLLREDWREAISTLIDNYKKQRTQQSRQSVSILAGLLTDMCAYQVSQKVLSREQAKQLQPVLEKQFYSRLGQRERQAHEALRDLYHYHNLDIKRSALPTEDNLFDTEKWIIWGLNRRQLLVAATMAGAATGAVVDLGLAGHSLFMGAITGGLIAGGSAWFGADRLADFKVSGLPMGGHEARQGPMKNRNFPYVLLSRYLFLHEALQQRTHARRDSLHLEEGDLSSRIDSLTAEQQKALHRHMEKLSQQQPTETLETALEPLLKH
jgi:GTPase Era involved in 16S rRNA processing